MVKGCGRVGNLAEYIYPGMKRAFQMFFLNTCKGEVESVEGVWDVPACHMARQARARK